MIQDKYRQCQTMCFCGLFPSIHRAWATIDNSLFLWRYDVPGDVPIEYLGQETSICSVGIVKPKAGVFKEAIKHVIVLCTTTEVSNHQLFRSLTRSIQLLYAFPSLSLSLSLSLSRSLPYNALPLPLCKPPSDDHHHHHQHD